MAGEPHPHHEASAHATTPPPRSAIWKSVIGATGGYGCERATFYRETVRGPDGWRLDDGASEPVLFGIAVDRAHGYLMADRLARGPADASLLGVDLSDDGTGEALVEDHLWDLAVAAVRKGMDVTRGRSLQEPMTDADWRLLAERVGLAVEKALGLWPNRTKEQTKAERDEGAYTTLPEPDGTPPGPPIAWLDQPAGVTTTPQRKIYAPGVVGGRGLSGQPDYVFEREGRIVGWVDVKALSRAGSYPAKWAAGEAVAYDYLCASANDGTPPEWHGYLEFRRVAKPYWTLITAPVEPASLRLAEAYFRRWERALDGNDPDGLAFSPGACAKCLFRSPIEEVAFGGCPVGEATLLVAPPVPDENGTDGY